MKTGADFIFVGSGAVELATRKANGMVRFCEGWVWNERLLTEVSEKRKGYGKCDNPSGSRPNFFGDSTSPLTREASVVVRGEGLLSFCNGCEGGSIRCNGRSKLTPLRKARCDSADAKPYKHTQTLALRKASGIVQMQNWQSVHMARVLAIFEG